MIQRPQTIILFLSVLQSCVIFMGAPIWVGASGIVVDIKNNLLLSSPIVLVCIASLIIIFLYNNRTLQMKLCKINLICNMLIIALYVFLLSSNNFQSLFQTNFRFAFFIPFVNVVLLAIALYYIKKDDDLIKSVDRIR